MLASDSEIYAIEFATCGAQTNQERDALAKQAVALNRELRDGRMGRERRGSRQPNDHPWKNDNRAMFEGFRAHGKAGTK